MLRITYLMMNQNPSVPVAKAAYSKLCARIEEKNNSSKSDLGMADMEIVSSYIYHVARLHAFFTDYDREALREEDVPTLDQIWLMVKIAELAHTNGAVSDDQSASFTLTNCVDTLCWMVANSGNASRTINGLLSMSPKEVYNALLAYHADNGLHDLHYQVSAF